MSQISWENSSWKQLSLVNDEEVISLSHARVYVFSDSVLCLGKVNQNPTSNTVWEQQLEWFKDSSQSRTLDTIDGEPMEFEWHIFPGFRTVQLVHEVQKVHEQNGRTRTIELSSCRCSVTSHGELKTIKRNVLPIPQLYLHSRKDFLQDLGPGSETKWYSTDKERPQGKWDRVNELMMIKFRESGHPVFRATSPLSRGTLMSKGGVKLSIHFCADGDTIETVFRTFISVNQLSIYGAVSDVCKEYSACQTRTERPVLAEQSDQFFAPANLMIMTPTSSIEIPAQEILLKSTRNEWKGFHNQIN